MPALASILSGRWPAAVVAGPQQLGWLPAETRTLPEILGWYGYDTAITAGPTLVSSPMVGSRFGAQVVVPPGQRKRLVTPMADWIASEAQEPFFALLHDLDLHMPGEGLGQDSACRWVSEPTICERFWSEPPDDAYQTLAPELGRERAAEIATALYDGILTGYDRALRQVFEAIDRRGVGERTIVVLLSNHGEDLGEHGQFGHGIHYDTVLRAPLVIADPTRSERAGARVPQMVQSIDVAPTVLELAGVPLDEAMVGRSLVPLLDGNADGYQVTEAFAMSDLRVASLRRPDRKLVYHPGPPPPPPRPGMKPPLGSVTSVPELYDLAADPTEVRDLIDTQPPDLAELEALLDAWLEDRRTATTAQGSMSSPQDPKLAERLRKDGYWKHVEQVVPPADDIQVEK